MKLNYAWDVALGKKKMIKTSARKIHKFRCIDNDSWRGVAYEATNGESSNQILGMKLCHIASNIYPRGKW